MRDVRILQDHEVEADASSTDKIHQLYETPLHKSTDDVLVGKGELTLAPGVAKAFSISALPLDAGNARLSEIILSCANDRFELEVSISKHDQLCQDYLWAPNITGLSKESLKRQRNLEVEILPKPPKMRIELLNLAKTYFTNEHIALDIHVINDEEEDSDVDLDVRLIGEEEEIPLSLRWALEVGRKGNTEEQLREIGDQDEPILIHSLTTGLGKLSPSETRKHVVLFQARPATGQCALEVKAR